MTLSYSVKVILLVSWVCLCSHSAHSQSSQPFACSARIPVSEYDFRKWISQDVAAIVSQSESVAFAKLKNSEDRLQFIENFWLRRDPNPDTDFNEYRDEYCRRVTLSEKFVSGIPGWRTDRGHILILWGEPSRIERGRQNYEGLSQGKFERWSYDYILGIGEKIDVTFVDPTESDEYRFLKTDKEWLAPVFECYRKGLSASPWLESTPSCIKSRRQSEVPIANTSR